MVGCSICRKVSVDLHTMDLNGHDRNSSLYARKTCLEVQGRASVWPTNEAKLKPKHAKFSQLRIHAGFIVFVAILVSIKTN